MAHIQKKVPQAPKPAAAPEPEQEQKPPTATPAAPEPEQEGYTVQHDEEAGTVTFALLDGTEYTIKEPKAKAFLLMQGWYAKAPSEYQSDAFATVKLVHGCIQGDKPGFDAFVDALELEDMERLGAALSCFRGLGERVKRMSAVQRAGAGVQG
ncbi:hypothetical protein [Pseudanabaena sp. FACHB-2040]|uniref:hypothetical protein n=1 Tax=Pseudanabaena sp. FACHB-2040 TaxID=2692859 RepID=UPI0016842090|nr:hypothetical protein [Pseudanabaena sp. FACHB-2040]MBD2256653.1 hypothetical protein [Pseudanabaena sp. FACHB-2040]